MTTITLDEALDELADLHPSRITLVKNPGSSDAVPFPVLFNPEILNETINVQWSKLQVIGLDHEVPHYTNTRSLAYSLEFYWSEFQNYARKRANPPGPRGSAVNRETALDQNATSFMNFLRSLCFPTRTGLRPPPLQIMWPGVFDLVGVVEKVHFTFARFDAKLAPIVYRASIDFLETRVTRRYSEDVALVGLVSDENELPSQELKSLL